MAEPGASVCFNCGEPIFLGQFNIWHHKDEWGYVVCGFGLDTDQPGELVAQWANPNPPKEGGRQRRPRSRSV